VKSYVPPWETPMIVAGAVLGTVALATILPAIRGTRASVIQAVAAGRAREASRPSRLLRGTARFTALLPLTFGLRDILARRQRALLTVLALTITVAAVVAGLIMEERFKEEDREEAAAVAATPAVIPGRVDAAGDAVPRDPITSTNPERERFRPVVHGLNGVLILLALANLLATSLLSVRERVRDFGVLRALGMTPGQVTASVVSANWVLGVGGALLGIPAGIALWRIVFALSEGGEGVYTLPNWGWTALAVAGVSLVTAIVCGLTARAAATIRVTEALRYE
jgi:ABC-type antimicrobial peptide transport system permease subunit